MRHIKAVGGFGKADVAGSLLTMIVLRTKS